MDAFVKVGGVWRTVRPPFVKVAGAWREIDRGFVKVNGQWRQWYTQSDPITVTYFANRAGLTYRGLTGPPSEGSNRGVLTYWGRGFNSEQELSMMFLNDPASLVADLAERPFILSGRVRHWVGHVYSGTQPVRWGWHNQQNPPASFSRLHSEDDPAWSVPGSFAKPPSGAGSESNFGISRQVLDTLQAQIPGGFIQGLTLTSESSNGIPQWGWSSGSAASTSNSGGNSGGIQDISNSNDPRSCRLELTIDFAPASTQGFT